MPRVSEILNDTVPIGSVFVPEEGVSAERLVFDGMGRFVDLSTGSFADVGPDMLLRQLQIPTPESPMRSGWRERANEFERRFDHERNARRTEQNRFAAFRRWVTACVTSGQEFNPSNAVGLAPPPLMVYGDPQPGDMHLTGNTPQIQDMVAAYSDLRASPNRSGSPQYCWIYTDGCDYPFRLGAGQGFPMTSELSDLNNYFRGSDTPLAVMPSSRRNESWFFEGNVPTIEEYVGHDDDCDDEYDCGCDTYVLTPVAEVFERDGRPQVPSVMESAPDLEPDPEPTGVGRDPFLNDYQRLVNNLRQEIYAVEDGAA